MGIHLYPDSTAATISGNNIQSNDYNIYLQEGTIATVKASNNWWGTTDTEAIAKSLYDYNKDFNLGKVTFTSYLTEYNSAAMPNPNAFMQTPAKPLLPTPTPPQGLQPLIDGILFYFLIAEVIAAVIAFGLIIGLVKYKKKQPL